MKPCVGAGKDGLLLRGKAGGRVWELLAPSLRHLEGRRRFPAGTLSEQPWIPIQHIYPATVLYISLALFPLCTDHITLRAR